MGKRIYLILLTVLTVIGLCILAPTTVRVHAENAALELGSIRSADGSEVYYGTRGRTAIYDVTEYSLTTDVEGKGIKYAIYSYAEDNSYLGWTGWLTSNVYTLQDGARYFRLVAAYQDDRAVDASGLSALSNCIFVEEIYNGPVWLEIGSIKSADGSEADYGHRSRTTLYEVSEYEMSLDVEGKGIKYAIYSYADNGNYLGWSGWLTGNTYTLKEGARYYRAVVSFQDDRMIDTAAALSELNSCISLEEIYTQQEYIQVEPGSIRSADGTEVYYNNRERWCLSPLKKY